MGNSARFRKVPGIYRIKNKINGKSYIGQAQNVSKRIYWHGIMLRSGKHSCIALQRSWNKHGEENFEFSLLLYCDISQLNEFEELYVKKFNSLSPNGYNLVPSGTARGAKRSDEAKARIKAGRARWLATPESRIQLSEKAILQHQEGKFGAKTWKNPRTYNPQAADTRRNSLIPDRNAVLWKEVWMPNNPGAHVFLPYPDFVKSVECLDDRRLVRQTVECKQILNTLVLTEPGWSRHPFVIMWRGYEVALMNYGRACVAEKMKRGIKNVQAFNVLGDLVMPHWLGDERIHSSHRSVLLKKYPGWYRKFGWTEKPSLEFCYPS